MSALTCAAPPEVKVDVHAPSAEPARPRAPVTIEVSASWPGASATEVERAITGPLEQALAEVTGVQRMLSASTPDRAVVTLVLAGDAQIDGVRLAVRERLAGAQASLPAEVAPPSLGLDLDPNTPPVIFTLTAGEAATMSIDALGPKITDALERVPGVGAVELCGARDPQRQISLDTQRLESFNIAVAAVLQAVRAGLEDSSAVRTPSLSLEDLAALVVVAGATPVRLRDLATITMQPGPAACEAMQVGGGAALLVVVRARRGATELNTGVMARIAQLRSELPPGVVLDVPAELVRIELELDAAAHETVTHHARAISRALAGVGLERPVFLRADAAASPTIDAELWVPLAAAKQTAVEQALRALPGLYVRGITGAAQADRSRTIVEISGDDLTTLQRLADEALALILRQADATGVVAGWVRTRLLATVAVDISRERVAVHGVSAADVQTTLQTALFGLQVGRVNIDGAAVPVVIAVGEPELDLAARTSIAGRLRVGTVPLSELVSFRATQEPAQISHVDRWRTVTLELRVPAASDLSALQRTVAGGLQLPSGYVVTWPSRVP